MLANNFHGFPLMLTLTNFRERRRLESSGVMHGLRRRAALALLERLARGRGRVRGDRLSTLSPYLFRVLLTAIEFKCTHREWYKLVHASVLNR